MRISFCGVLQAARGNQGRTGMFHLYNGGHRLNQLQAETLKMEIKTSIKHKYTILYCV